MEEIDINTENTVNGVLISTIEALFIDDTQLVSPILINKQPAIGNNTAMFL